MNSRAESAISAAVRWCAERWVQAPAEHQRFWLARSRFFRALSGRTESAARRLFKILTGLEDHPAAARLFGEPTKTVTPAKCKTPLEFLGKPLACGNGKDFAALIVHGEISAWLFPPAEYVAKLGAKRVFVGINSTGGDTDTALQLFDALQGREVEVEISGRCYSAAATLAMAGTRRRMARGGRFLIHTPIDCAMGPPGELRFRADCLEKIVQRCVDIYQRATGLSRATISGWLTDGLDHYFDSQAALRAGLVHEVFAPAPLPPAAPCAPALTPMEADDDSEAAELALEVLARLEGQFKSRERFVQVVNRLCAGPSHD